MYESRCGVRCSVCERKEKVACKGCTCMEHPFWGGECLVKTCCEKRDFDHCGLCPDFPCDMLSNMGKEEGFDSSEKIKQCKIWAGENPPMHK
jgi:hypothetical protein